MTNISFLRHSISEANEEGIYDSGAHDADLSENGIKYAILSALEVETCPDVIYASDMNRALQTAQLFALVMKEKFGREIHVFTVEGLRAQDHGVLEGQPLDAPIFELPHETLQKIIGGESDFHSWVRQRKGILSAVEQAKKGGYDNALIVTHTDVIARYLIVTENADYDTKEIGHCQQVGPFPANQVIKGLALPKIRKAAPKQKPNPKPPGA